MDATSSCSIVSYSLKRAKSFYCHSGTSDSEEIESTLIEVDSIETYVSPE